MARDPADRPSAKTLVKVLRATTPEEAKLTLAASMVEDGQPVVSRRTSYCLPEGRKLARWSSMP